MMILAVMLIGFFLRLVGLNQSLWLDEAIQVLAVKNNSFFDLLTKYSLGDFHPPAYHLILKLWTGVFGYSEISARFPSVIFGVVTIFFVYLIGKKLIDRKAGLIAGLFLAISPLAIYYSQEARMYSLAAMAISGAVYFFLEKKWFWHFLFLLGALYTDYLTYFMLPVFFLLVKNKKSYLLSSFFTLLFVLPWLPFLYQQLHAGVSTASANPLWKKVVGGFDFIALPLTFVKFIIGRISLADKAVYALIMTPVVAFYSLILSRGKNVFLWLWLVIPLIIGFLISVFIPVFSYFRFLFILPAFCLLLAAGTHHNKASVILIGTISLLSLAIFNLDSRFQREDWRSAVQYFSQNPATVVIPSLAQAAPITYYGPKIPVVDSRSLNFKGNNTVYLLRYVQEIFDPQDLARTSLEANNYKKIQERSFNGVVVWKYQK